MNNVKDMPEKNIERFKDYPLDNEIKRGLSDLGFKNPLKVQAKVIPMILDGKDLIVQSQTGSGKTAAFAIPICQKIDAALESRPPAEAPTPTTTKGDALCFGEVESS
jgi:superfamily II DNA/RNA helicase